jgi:hypothetical protein
MPQRSNGERKIRRAHAACYPAAMLARRLSALALPVLLVSAALLIAPRLAHATPPDVTRVREMLSSYEAGPPESAWRALGPETLPVLIALYDSAQEAPFVRQRAVAASAYYPSAATRLFLRAVLATPGQHEIYLRTAVDALARAFGADAWDEVRPYLAHEVVTVRMGAVRAATRINTPAVRAVLRQRLQVEADAEVRAALTAALAR